MKHSKTCRNITESHAIVTFKIYQMREIAACDSILIWFDTHFEGSFNFLPIIDTLRLLASVTFSSTAIRALLTSSSILKLFLAEPKSLQSEYTHFKRLATTFDLSLTTSCYNALTREKSILKRLPFSRSLFCYSVFRFLITPASARNFLDTAARSHTFRVSIKIKLLLYPSVSTGIIN